MENNKIPAFTADTTSENIDRIAQLFPQAITEKENEDGSTSKAIDFDILKQYLSNELVEGDRERFRLDWPGKKASILKANTPIAKTLRPVRADSVDFDTTQNVYIEGDNFEVLKVLQESYLGKIKMIYIDPPYNTGKDFIYKDNFTQDKSEYEEEIGVRDDENGGKLVKNTETNGRYHSDWLSMMQERLIVARDLLTDDGVIFISIDDNEQANLKGLSDEIFGESNFVNQFLWLHGKGKKDSWSRTTQQYILCYAKDKESLEEWSLLNTQNYSFTNPDNDPRGGWFSGSVSFSEERSNPKHRNFMEIKSPSGVVWRRQWLKSNEEMKALLAEDKIFFGLAPAYDATPRVKIFPGDVSAQIPSNLISDAGTTKSAQTELDKLIGGSYFDYPKPVDLIKLITDISTRSKPNSFVMDFFSGSGTTAHAVMQLNAEDGGNRKHIQVQLAEPTDEKSEAYKAGYKSIPEISRERIRRAAKKIREDYAEQIAKRDTPLDTGFRVFKVDTPIFKDVEKHPTEFDQENLFGVVDNIKEDRTPEDILTHTILRLGLTLDVSIETKKIDGQDVYFVEGNALVACFDTNISNAVIEAIAEAEPLKAVFRDAGFAEDKDRINIETLFKQKSPNTDVRVI